MFEKKAVTGIFRGRFNDLFKNKSTTVECAVVVNFIAYILTGDRRTPRRQSKTTDFGGSQPNDLFEILHIHLYCLPFRLKRDEVYHKLFRSVKDGIFGGVCQIRAIVFCPPALRSDGGAPKLPCSRIPAYYGL